MFGPPEERKLVVGEQSVWHSQMPLPEGEICLHSDLRCLLTALCDTGIGYSSAEGTLQQTLFYH